MDSSLNTVEARVIGALIEKEITTPDHYPLSLNALTAACNQKSNREPVMALTEAEVQEAVDSLHRKHLVLDRSGFGSRVVKYKQRFCNTEFSDFHFSPGETAIVCLLLLRGPQTPGELRSRSGRLHRFEDLGEVEQCLRSLNGREGGAVVTALPREPGRREIRWQHQFGAGSDADASPEPPSEEAAHGDDDLLTRIEKLEGQVSGLLARITALEDRDV